MSRASPLFVAAVEARMALEAVEDKLRNVRRRRLTRGELYALRLVADKAYELADRIDDATPAAAAAIALRERKE